MTSTPVPMGETPTSQAWLCDVNVLLALALATHVHHRAAHAALRGHAGGWATCPMTEAALLRLLLNPRVTGVTYPAAEVRGVLRGMRQDPRWRWVPDDTSLSEAVVDVSALVGHGQVTDLHLVNLAAARGLVLVTFDAAIPTWLPVQDRPHVRVLPH